MSTSITYWEDYVEQDITEFKYIGVFRDGDYTSEPITNIKEQVSKLKFKYGNSCRIIVLT